MEHETKSRIGWKLYFAFYVALVASEIVMDLHDSSGLVLGSLKATFALAFSLPLFCYAFRKNLIPKQVARVIFYICVFWWVYVLAGTDKSTEQLLMAVIILALYTPGFVAINRYKRQAHA